jgi:hypothetical protein
VLPTRPSRLTRLIQWATSLYGRQGHFSFGPEEAAEVAAYVETLERAVADGLWPVPPDDTVALSVLHTLPPEDRAKVQSYAAWLADRRAQAAIRVPR